MRVSDDNDLAAGEYWVTQVDPDTGRVTHSVESNWLLAPLYGLAELGGDIANGRMRTRDWVFVLVVLALIVRA